MFLNVSKLTTCLHVLFVYSHTVVDWRLSKIGFFIRDYTYVLKALFFDNFFFIWIYFKSFNNCKLYIYNLGLYYNIGLLWRKTLIIDIFFKFRFSPHQDALHLSITGELRICQLTFDSNHTRLICIVISK